MYEHSRRSLIGYDSGSDVNPDDHSQYKQLS